MCGLYEVIPMALLSVFTPAELLLLLCGEAHIDVDDWQRNTTYSGGCNP